MNNVLISVANAKSPFVLPDNSEVTSPCVSSPLSEKVIISSELPIVKVSLTLSPSVTNAPVVALSVD